MLFDSHAHLNFEAFQDDWKDVVLECQKAGVWLVNVGSQLKTSKKAVEIAKKYEVGVYAAVGMHPTHVGQHDFDINDYRRLVEASKKVVAIGEVGLDYYRVFDNKAEQKDVLKKHIDLASEFHLPVLFHCRDSSQPQGAYDDLLGFLRALDRIPRGVVHCFGGTWRQAQEFLALGLDIGITGIVTFGKKVEELETVARNIPLEKLLIETDSPYLTPVPFRGKERNKPLYVKYVAEKIAELRGQSYSEVALQTFENACLLLKVESQKRSIQ